MSRSLVCLRSAQPEDAVDLADLWTDFLRRTSMEDQVADMESVLKALLETTDQRIIVAEYDGEFAGAVHLEATTMTALNSEPIVRALSPHVLPRFQRHGVGSALMDAAVSWAEELGIGHVATAAVAGSRDANRFMARLGLAPAAVLRVAPTGMLRAKLPVEMPGVARPLAGAGRSHLGQVLAQRRSLRRSQGVS